LGLGELVRLLTHPQQQLALIPLLLALQLLLLLAVGAEEVRDRSLAVMAALVVENLELGVLLVQVLRDRDMMEVAEQRIQAVGAAALAQ
jgi:hypothetical protein